MSHATYRECIPDQLPIQELERDVAVQRAVRVREAHAENAVGNRAVLAVPQEKAKVEQSQHVPQALSLLRQRPREELG